MSDDITLLDIAKSDLRISDMVLDNLIGDKCELNQAAYHLHPALEKQ